LITFIVSFAGIKKYLVFMGNLNIICEFEQDLIQKRECREKHRYR